MELRLEPKLASKVARWSAQTGRPAHDLVEDALESYLTELNTLRDKLDERYDAAASGSAPLVEGHTAYRLLKERAEKRRKSIA
jgi:hypothetical protein